MSATKVRLWLMRETEKARRYSMVPFPDASDKVIWIPKSIIEHTSKEPSGLHIVTLPDWFADQEEL